MKKIILGLLTLTVFAGYSQAITVNTTTSATTLVNTIFNGTASNISRSSGNGLGSFQNTNPAFPLSSGIVICGGNSNSISGTSTMSTTGSGVSDSDLQAFSNASGSTGFIQDASFLSFNFVAATSSLSMDYVFASEEYGAYQCGFSDKVAFLLTNLTTGVTTNIAVVPQTTTPVSVNTIRSNVYNSGCPSVNAQYFGAYDASNNSSLSGTCFNGRTVLLNASSNLVIGDTYKLKIVIGDWQDSLFDSAIFMKSSLLDTNILGADLTIANNTAVCQGNSVTLTTGLSTSNYTFLWKKDGVVIPSQTNSSLVVTQPGTYEVIYTNIATTLVSLDSIIVEYNVAPQLLIINPPSVCSPQTVDITSPNVVIESDAEGIITYWTNAACTTPLVNPSSIAQSGTYYVKSSNSCGFDVEPVVVSINQAPVLYSSGDIATCTFFVLPVLLVGEYYTGPNGTGVQIPAGTAITSNQLIYVYASNGNCSNQTFFMVYVYSTDNSTTLNGNTITANQNGATYQWYLCGGVPSTPIIGANSQSYTAISNGLYSVLVTSFDGCSEMSSCVEISSLKSTAFEMSNVSVSPNPIIDFMTVSAKENINSIAIFNTLGQLVFEKKVNTSEEKIDLTALTSGNYIVKITSETSSKVLKIIKQ
ncbi:MAG: choice-of-anchor L domain-containing protein [Flavobacterium sp.]|uniref:choice-of-anchor L domain-containing protein n=1 Tax=Flavobacterium sp. TaxID=239 RepID=UPI0022C4061B|nr:choice-of-anchor L domain-containing protein [Flavobacterium sp.]MCZ8198003.1 choice-of-anchor L domain-containing protein [Flavobacterium sp.]